MPLNESSSLRCGRHVCCVDVSSKIPNSIIHECPYELLNASFDICCILLMYLPSHFYLFWEQYFQVRVKAVCVLESIVRKKDDDDHFSRMASYFAENNDLVLRCSESPQASLREKANKVPYFNFSFISYFLLISIHIFFFELLLFLLT